MKLAFRLSFFQSKSFIYANIFILFFLVNVIAYNINWKLDLSKGNINTLSGSTKKVLNQLKYPLLIEAYISRDIPGQIFSQLQPIIYQLEDIQRQNHSLIQLKIIDPNNEELRSLASKRGIQGIPIEEAEIDKASVRLGYFGVYLQYTDRHTTFSLVEQGGILSNFEYVFLKEVKKLLQDPDTRISGIGYLNTEGTGKFRRWQTRLDMDKDNYFAFKNFIEKEMGEIREIQLDQPIPDTIETLLVIGLPNITQKEQVYLDQFLLRGGNLILMLKGFDFTITPPNPQLMQLGLSSGSRGFTTIPDELKIWNEFLGKYGLGINERVILEPNLAAPEIDILGQFLGRYPNPSWAVYTAENNNILSDVEFLRYIPMVIFPWFSDLRYNPNVQPQVKYKVLIQTSDEIIARKQTSLELKDLQFLDKNTEGQEKIPQQLPVMILAQGKFQSAFKDEYQTLDIDPNLKANFNTGQLGNTEGRILLIGTPYLVSDIFFRNEANMEYFKINFAFVQNVIEYFQGDLDLLEVRSKIPILPVIQLQLPKELQTAFAWFHTLTIPVLFAIYGFLRLKKRYQKRGDDL
ncbi:MAG: GldG family protein [Leptospiraceae bacterium]|nr:GldG family protein [Leptospiraceae bacterium]MDW7975614.1 GldG family protein [Leptospiraceae bacterium]